LFAHIAPRYDLINDLQSLGWHRVWKRRLAGLVPLSGGGWVLDLCCGTGDVARAANRRGARVVGLDFSAPMLERAQARASGRAAGGPGSADFGADAGTVRWLRGDALALPFPEHAFDAVTIAYGLRNLSSLEAGLKECWRVTRPGGLLLALEFGKPGNPLLRHLYTAYLRLGVPLFGRLLCGDAAAYAYIAESLEDYPAAAEVGVCMNRCGWTDVQTLALWGGTMTLQRARRGY
jgi:demethylmenaquinone methyltransferase/2-methoxy-6-polyprenyl-1,4-benzoquinol methylase